MSKAFYAVDSSGNGKHCQYVNVNNADSQLPESQKQAFFQGRDDSYVLLPAANTVGVSYNFSVFFYRKSGKVVENGEVIFTQPSPDSVRVSVSLKDGQLVLTSGDDTQAGTTKIKEDTTYHLFLSVSQTETILYLDGREEVVWQRALVQPGTTYCQMGVRFYGYLDEAALLPFGTNADTINYLNFVARAQDPRRINHALFSGVLSSSGITLEKGGRVAKSANSTFDTAICDTVAYDGGNWEFEILGGVEAVIGLCTEGFAVVGDQLGSQPNSLGYDQNGLITWANAEGLQATWEVDKLTIGDAVRMSLSEGTVNVYVNNSEVLSHVIGEAGWRPATSLKSGTVSLNTGQANFYGQEVLDGLYRLVDTPATSEPHYQGHYLLPLNEVSGLEVRDTTGSIKGTYSDVQLQLPTVSKYPEDVSVSLGETGTITATLPEIVDEFAIGLSYLPAYDDSVDTAVLLDTNWLTVSLVSGCLDVAVGGSSVFREIRLIVPGFKYSVLLAYSGGRLSIWSGAELLAEVSVVITVTGTDISIGTKQDGSARLKGRLSHLLCVPYAPLEWQRVRLTKHLVTGQMVYPTSEALTGEPYGLPAIESLNFTIGHDYEQVILENYLLPTSEQTDFTIGAA